jgi:hypothetical protein
VTIDEIGDRNLAKRIAVARLVVIVYENRVCEGQVVLKGGDSYKLADLIYIHGENGKWFSDGLLLRIQFLDDGELFDAGRAIDLPKGEQDGFASKVAEVECACPIEGVDEQLVVLASSMLARSSVRRGRAILEGVVLSIGKI